MQFNHSWYNEGVRMPKLKSAGLDLILKTVPASLSGSRVPANEPDFPTSGTAHHPDLFEIIVR